MRHYGQVNDRLFSYHHHQHHTISIFMIAHRLHATVISCMYAFEIQTRFPFLAKTGCPPIFLIFPPPLQKDAQRGSERLREAQRSSERLREAQGSSEKFKEAQRGSGKLRDAQRRSEELGEAQRSSGRLRELDSELGELEIHSSGSCRSRAQGAVLGAGLEEAIARICVRSTHPLRRGQKEKVCDLIQVPREAQK